MGAQSAITILKHMETKMGPQSARTISKYMMSYQNILCHKMGLRNILKHMRTENVTPECNKHTKTYGNTKWDISVQEPYHNL